jgi:hypothetical protein
MIHEKQKILSRLPESKYTANSTLWSAKCGLQRGLNIKRKGGNNELNQME